LTLTAVSLAWTGWSYTAEERLNLDNLQTPRSESGLQQQSVGSALDLDQPFLDPEDRLATGLVTTTDHAHDFLTSSSGGAGAGVWKLNVVMTLISCFVAMILTGWGTIAVIAQDETNTNAVNPTIGRVNMA
jgi:hypothetical protein